jgi:hypothetical protein
VSVRVRVQRPCIPARAVDGHETLVQCSEAVQVVGAVHNDRPRHTVRDASGANRVTELNRTCKMTHSNDTHTPVLCTIAIGTTEEPKSVPGLMYASSIAQAAAQAAEHGTTVTIRVGQPAAAKQADPETQHSINQNYLGGLARTRGRTCRGCPRARSDGNNSGSAMTAQLQVPVRRM